MEFPFDDRILEERERIGSDGTSRALESIGKQPLHVAVERRSERTHAPHARAAQHHQKMCLSEIRTGKAAEKVAIPRHVISEPMILLR
jgi:hypothetical protein